MGYSGKNVGYSTRVKHDGHMVTILKNSYRNYFLKIFFKNVFFLCLIKQHLPLRFRSNGKIVRYTGKRVGYSRRVKHDRHLVTILKNSYRN